MENLAFEAARQRRLTERSFRETNTLRPRAATSVSQSIWQFRSARGETVWTWITWAFAGYWILFVAGAFLDRKQLNAVGGVLVLGVLAWLLLERLWVRLDAIVVASLLSGVCLPLLQIICSSPPTAEALFKHVSLCMVMAASRLLQLPVASRSRMRFLLAAQVLGILLISLTIYRGASWDGGTRHSGLFVNPNNLALIPFLLLFLVNPVRDSRTLRLAVHGVVIAVLAYSGTNGAVVAYAVGLAIHFRLAVSRAWRTTVYCALALGLLTVSVFVGAGGDKFLPETRLTNQISVMRTQFQTVLQGGDIAYYEQERVLGPGSGSAVWRLSHWRRTLVTYLSGNPLQQVFGFGLGSSPLILGKLPHNEYLRMLFEQGLIGLLLFLFSWTRMIKTASAEVSYVGIIIAIYSFSENNLDNFPFMALFTLCLSARGLVRSAPIRMTLLTAPTCQTKVEKNNLHILNGARSV